MADEHDASQGTPPDSPPDPLDLDAVDREIRLNELRERVDDLGPSSMFVSEDCPPEVESEFLQRMINFETGPVTSYFERLADDGVDLPEPDLLDDAALTEKLWEVIRALAGMDAFLSRTDHMSDRELYTHLWEETLREETPCAAPGSGWVWHIDMLGGCSEEDLENSLRYYDTEEEREHWAREFPDDVIPPHVDPPYDRDRHLPQDPQEWSEPDEE